MWGSITILTAGNQSPASCRSELLVLHCWVLAHPGAIPRELNIFSVFRMYCICIPNRFPYDMLQLWMGWTSWEQSPQADCRKAQFPLLLFLPYSYQGPQWRLRIFADTVPSAWDMPSRVLKGHRNPLQRQSNALLPNPKWELLSFILFIFKILFFSLRILYGVFDYFHLSSSSFLVCHPFPTHIVLCLCFPILLCTCFRHLLICLLALPGCGSSSDRHGFLFWGHIPAFLVSYTPHENENESSYDR